MTGHDWFVRYRTCLIGGGPNLIAVPLGFETPGTLTIIDDVYRTVQL